MSELRLTGKTPDGQHLALTDHSGGDYSLRISESLRATVNQSRLSAVPVSDENQVMSVKEMQRRLRAGESMDSIARDGNISVEKIQRFAGPILQERAFVISQVHALSPRREGKDGGRDNLTFLEIVNSKLAPRGVDIDCLDWNSWRLEDGTWTIELHYPNKDGVGVAQFGFDGQRRSLAPLDNDAAWIMGEDAATRRIDAGLIYSHPSHPSRMSAVSELPDNDPTDTEFESPTARETPRLVSIRESPAPADKADGISARAKIPSWDEIMFGQKPTDDSNSEN